MKLIEAETKIRMVKTWTYIYKTKKELEQHKKDMLKAKFDIEKEGELEITYAQKIKEC